MLCSFIFIRMNKKILTALLGFLLLVAAGTYLTRNLEWSSVDDDSDANNVSTASMQPLIRYGIDLSSFIVEHHVVKPNEFFADILTKYNVAYSTVDFLARESGKIFNLNRIKAGNKCTMLCDKTDSGLVCKKLIYEESKTDYVVFNLEDSLYVYRGQKEVERKQMEVSGVINSSLYETLDENGISTALAVRMADIFAWSIDFYRIQKGDKFKVVYDEDFVRGESVGIGEVKAILFNSGGRDFYAFNYKKDKDPVGDYYDENGNSMKQMFLKAPVKFSRISSHYSLKRFHPVTKQWKAHLGTDYAAPTGTPIMSTADGTIIEAQFKKYNGNYVKIRHNGEYKTQYLHMSKIAKGIHPGVKVKQGDIIGYVGSTGLATGPHVCYRFWLDNKQVDPLKQRLSFTEPLPAKYKADYLRSIQGMKATLDAITYKEHNVVAMKLQRDNQAEALRQATDFTARFF